MRGSIRPTIDADTMQVRLECPSGNVVAIDGGLAICTKCGAHVAIGDLLDDLHECARSLSACIASIRPLTAEVPSD